MNINDKKSTISHLLETVMQSVGIHKGCPLHFFSDFFPAELRPGFQDEAHQDAIIYEAKPQLRVNRVD